MGALCRALRNSSSKGELKDTYVDDDLGHRKKKIATTTTTEANGRESKEMLSTDLDAHIRYSMSTGRTKQRKD